MQLENNGVGAVWPRPDMRSLAYRAQDARLREEALPIRGIPSGYSVARDWNADHRAVALGGVALVGILMILASVTVRVRAGDMVIPSLREMEVNASLFRGLVPHIAAFSIGYYAVFAWASVAALWLVYLRLVWCVRSGHIDHRVIAAGALSLGFLAVAVPPVFSTDIFSYAMFGRLAAVYHLNPYLTTAASSAPGDVLIPYLYWRDIPSPYGPLWTLLSQVIAYGHYTTVFDLVVRFKAVSFLSFMLDGWLIYVLVRERWPAQASWAYLAFAWNPLVIIEGVVAGHNDLLILAVVLGSAYLLTRTHSQLAIAGLTVSGLVKYSTFPVMGIAALRLLLRTPTSRRVRLTLTLGLTTVVLFVFAFAPYWSGLRGLASTLDEPGRGINNPLLMAIRGLVVLASAGHLRLGTLATVALSVAAFIVWQMVNLWRERERVHAWTIDGELASWAATLVVFLLLWPRIHTWYFLVPLGLSLAAGPSHRRVFGVILLVTIVSYTSYFW